MPHRLENISNTEFLRQGIQMECLLREGAPRHERNQNSHTLLRYEEVAAPCCSRQFESCSFGGTHSGSTKALT